MTNLQRDAMAYAGANAFIRELKKYRDTLTPQQIRTLKGQALAGDVQGAEKGLQRVLRL